MIRKIIEINEEKCNGCGLCAKACHENAIGMVNGKAKLLRDDIVTDWETVCRPAQPERSRLLSGKQRHMTKQLWKQIREKRTGSGRSRFSLRRSMPLILTGQIF